MRKPKHSIFLIILLLSGVFLFLQVVPIRAQTTSTFQISATTNDGAVSGASSVYATAHSTASSASTTQPDTGQLLSGGTYYVDRGFLKFDTSSVPAGATITSAGLDFYGSSSTLTGGNFTINIQKWTGDTPIDTGDFNSFDGTNYDDGLFSTVAWADSAWNNVTISNFTLITKGGNTLICYRSSKDISSTAPTGGEYVIPTDYTTNPALATILQITYTYTTPEYHYVVKTNNIDGVADVGTHSSFAAEQAGPDNTNDTLTEAVVVNSTQVANQQLWVNGYDNAEPGWTRTGSSPYLNAIDDPTNRISCATATNATSKYSYADLTNSMTQIISATLCVYAYSSTTDGADIYLYNSSGLQTVQLAQVMGASYAWFNFTVTTILPTYSEVNEASLRFVYYYVGGKSTTYVDASLLRVTYNYTNYQLAIEEQWTNANYTRTYRELCLFMGPYSNAETIGLQWWNTTSSTWLTINSSLVTNAWNNITVTTYLTAATFTIQFIDGTQSSDAVQSTWQKDCALLHTWETAGNSLSWNPSATETYSAAQSKTVSKSASPSVSLTYSSLLFKTNVFSKTFLSSATAAFASAVVKTVTESIRKSSALSFTDSVTKTVGFSSLPSASFAFTDAVGFATVKLLSWFGSGLMSFADALTKTFSFAAKPQATIALTDKATSTFSFATLRSSLLTFTDILTKTIKISELRTAPLSFSAILQKTVSFTTLRTSLLSFADNVVKAFKFTTLRSSLLSFSDTMTRTFNLLPKPQAALSFTDNSLRTFSFSTLRSSTLGFNALVQWATSTASHLNWYGQAALSFADTISKTLQFSTSRSSQLSLSSVLTRAMSITTLRTSILSFADSMTKQFTVASKNMASLTYADILSKTVSFARSGTSTFTFSASQKDTLNLKPLSKATLSFADTVSKAVQTMFKPQTSLAYSDLLKWAASIFSVTNQQWFGSAIINFVSSIGTPTATFSLSHIPVGGITISDFYGYISLFGAIAFVCIIAGFVVVKKLGHKEETGASGYVEYER
jgi:hypothetical protein